MTFATEEDLRHINAIDAHVEPEQGHTDHVSIASGARRGPWANGTRPS